MTIFHGSNTIVQFHILPTRLRSARRRHSKLLALKGVMKYDKHIF